MDDLRTELLDGLELFENLPTNEPLVLEELRKVALAKIGLRSTSPTRVVEELQKGTEGDLILLSDFSHLVGVNDSAYEKFAEALGGAPSSDSNQGELYKGALAQIAVRDNPHNRFKEAIELIDLSQLPVTYEEALRLFISRKAIPFVNYQVTEKTTLEKYLEDQIPLASPILLFVNANDDQGYDHANYFNFGKRGRGFISKERFIGREGLTEADITLLQRRYQKYKQVPVTLPGIVKNEPRTRLYHKVDRDISQLLLGHATNGIRTIINK